MVLILIQIQTRKSLQDMQGGLKFQLCVLEICISSSHTLLKRITKRLLLIAMSMIVTKCILVGSHALLAPPLLTKMQEEMRTLQKIFHYLQHTDLRKSFFLVLTTVETFNSFRRQTIFSSSQQKKHSTCQI